MKRRIVLQAIVLLSLTAGLMGCGTMYYSYSGSGSGASACAGSGSQGCTYYKDIAGNNSFVPTSEDFLANDVEPISPTTAIDFQK
jgi:hypothetical protein